MGETKEYGDQRTENGKVKTQKQNTEVHALDFDFNRSPYSELRSPTKKTTQTKSESFVICELITR